MDKTSIIGIVVAVAFIMFGILSSGSILTFIDIPSILIVFGGTFGTLVMSARKKNISQLFKIMGIVFKKEKLDDHEIIDNLVRLNIKSRKEGLLSLEDDLQSIDDKFIQKGLMMVIDGSDPEVVKQILNSKVKGTVERHNNNRALLDTGAALAPAFGMLGTLIGLVNMLKTLSDPSTIGPQMSVALVTTFYGSLLANTIFIPMSKKLKAKTESEVYQKKMIIEGILSIQMGENPNMMREKLLSFFSDEESDIINEKLDN